jgi:hypothetical protein
MLILDLFPPTVHQYDEHTLPHPLRTYRSLTSLQQLQTICAMRPPPSAPLISRIEIPQQAITFISVDESNATTTQFTLHANELYSISALPEFFYRTGNQAQNNLDIAIRQGVNISMGGVMWRLRMVDIGQGEIHAYYESQTSVISVLLRLSLVRTDQLEAGSSYYLPRNVRMNGGGEVDIPSLFHNQH